MFQLICLITSALEMDVLTIVVNLLFTWVATDYLMTLIKRSKLNPKRQPPGPLPFPVVGNLFSLGSMPHKSLAELAKIHGPAMLLKLGYNLTLVISSPSLAREAIKSNHDKISGRSTAHASTALDHHLSSVAILPPNAKWRAFRKICATKVLANSRLDATQVLRRKHLSRLISYVQKCCKTAEAVDIGVATFATSLNSITDTFLSMDLVDLGSEKATEFKELVRDIVRLAGAPDITSFFPLLKMVDPQGSKRRMAVHFRRLLQIFDGMIQERLELRKSAGMNDHNVTMENDVLDALLNIDNVKELSLSDIPHLLMDLFIGGTESIPLTIEWAMTELLRNPEKMKKAQAELQEVIGTDNLVKENDHLRLPYLRAVIKETFRLHPPSPLLVPRKVITEAQLGDFTLLKNTTVLVNIWAIGRDPELWRNVALFEPERFLDSTIDYKGNDFELIPFGSGCRRCPGMPLASRFLHWMLGTLIHSVNWKLEDGMKPEDIDVNEEFGLTLQKAKPLRAIPVLKHLTASV